MGLASLGLTLATAVSARAIDAHARLLLAWNEHINLTAIRTPEAVARLHVLDSLSARAGACGDRSRAPRPSWTWAAAAAIPGMPLGAGAPGSTPDARRLGGQEGALPGGRGRMPVGRARARTAQPSRISRSIAARAEQLAADERRETWDVVTVRAVGTLAEVAELGMPLLRRGGLLVCWKRERMGRPARTAGRAAQAGRGAAGRACRCIGDLGGDAPEVVAGRGRLACEGHRLVLVRKVRPDAAPLPARCPRNADGACYADARMRVAILTDIHANLPALEAVLDACTPYDAVWVMGDIVGYGPYPDDVVARLRKEHAVAVRGNHDAAVLGDLDTSVFNEDARLAVEWTADRIGTAIATLAGGAARDARRGRLHARPRQPPRPALGVPHHGAPRTPQLRPLRDTPRHRRATRTCPASSATTAATSRSSRPAKGHASCSTSGAASSTRAASASRVTAIRAPAPWSWTRTRRAWSGCACRTPSRRSRHACARAGLPPRLVERLAHGL